MNEGNPFMNAIEIAFLSKTYRNKKFQKIEALKNLCLEVRQGEVVGFLGPNGAGKSTTIKMVVGLIKPSSGCVKVFGQDVANPSARKKMGFLPENPAFYDFLSAREYLFLVGRTFKMSGEKLARNCDEVLELVDLASVRNRPMRTYSKGMIQRLGLAQALIHDPEILVFDEPMSGLDPVGRAMVKEIIINLKSRGKTVFFSTHITSDIESTCDRVAILNKGELQRVDEIDRLLIEGVSGYRINFRRSNGLLLEKFVGKSELFAALQVADIEGHEVLLVEPCRKSLEQYFIGTIGGDK